MTVPDTIRTAMTRINNNKKRLIAIFGTGLVIGGLVVADPTKRGYYCSTNRLEVAVVLSRINSTYPKRSPYTGRIKQYWQNDVKTNVCASNTYYYVVIKPSVYQYLTAGEQASLTNSLPVE